MDSLDALINGLASAANASGNAALAHQMQSSQANYGQSLQNVPQSYGNPGTAHSGSLAMGGGAGSTSGQAWAGFGGLGGIGQQTGQSSQSWATMRAYEQNRAYALMSEAVRERFEPVCAMMDIELTPPPVPTPHMIVSEPCQWIAMIRKDTRTYRHVWDMYDGSETEWAAELGHFLDKVGRITGSAVETQNGSDDTDHGVT